MAKTQKQTNLFRGIYEFEDSSGTLLASKVPQVGSVDLYQGTAVIVRPNQCTILIYKGQIADVLRAGLHEIETENVPILTKLANWKFGFSSPLRAELWFFSGSLFTSRRWGTQSPVLIPFEGLGTVPIRGYGQYSIGIKDPRKLLLKLIGTQSNYDVTQLDEFIQGQILETLPGVLSTIKDLRQINTKNTELSHLIVNNLNQKLETVGLFARNIQILSLLPTKDVLEAMDAKVAMDVIGNARDFLLFKAAKSLAPDSPGNTQSNDPMQMMMGLVLGNKLLGAENSKESVLMTVEKKCPSCSHSYSPSNRFCGNCGKEV